MDNYDIAEIVGTFAKLADLHNQNSFKVKAFQAAAFNIKKTAKPLAEMSEEEISILPGIGKSVQKAVFEILNSQSFTEYDELLKQTPAGVLEIMQIKGLGPKKVQTIWRELNIETVEELFDFCRENRLTEVKGFGVKMQNEIIRGIEFRLGAKGKIHYYKAEKMALEWMTLLKKEAPGELHSVTGGLRRCDEIIEKLEFVSTASSEKLVQIFESQGCKLLFQNGNLLQFKDAQELILEIQNSSKANFNRSLFESTATELHLQKIGYVKNLSYTAEEQVYELLNWPFVIPEMRNGLNELEVVQKYSSEPIIQFSDLKGALHNHTTYSDGLHSLEDMANFCKLQGYEYLGICDHSKSAQYANGLKEDRLEQQWNEIDAINKKHSDFVVFKGIESDILLDGSLDYNADILKQFDFVVASIHSVLKMEKSKANERLKTAIENPYTTILGHPTGRLLLIREGYSIDHEYIIDCCAANGVSIELNAHPYRLDLDWRYIDYAMNKGVLISINPDAHEKEGFHDMYFGTLAARKAGLLKSMTLNTKNRTELAAFFQQKKGAILN